MIDGEFLNNLRFAGDIIYSYSQEDHKNYNIMLLEQSEEIRQMGLKIIIAKTKVMVVDNTPTNVKNLLIEKVECFE